MGGKGWKGGLSSDALAIGARPIITKFGARLHWPLMGKHEGNGFIEQERDHFPLLDPAIAESLVNFRRALVGVNHGAPVVRTKMMKHRREIGVAREDDELSEPGRMLKEIANIAGDLDVGAVLELRRERLKSTTSRPAIMKLVRTVAKACGSCGPFRLTRTRPGLP